MALQIFDQLQELQYILMTGLYNVNILTSYISKVNFISSDLRQIKVIRFIEYVR
jgi:hypothetical protein